MKEKVTREFFDKHFSPGFCPVCEHFISETEECEIAHEAEYATMEEAYECGLDKGDADRMDCVLWEYKYTTE